ncbi:hypothetical protein D4764_10G0003090 [Takifugu flavidus]|uniref:Uncharacterized protein n=1 Tax=Takifugu flavidus TaxID=433684 RepID=A0A5C6PK40_9TELE|nr:hypothetical protein D4764_10G0003090 [Takifugu flavidus]
MTRTPEVMMAVTSHKMSDSLRKARRRKAAVKKTKKKKGPTGNAATERGKKKKKGKANKQQLQEKSPSLLGRNLEQDQADMGDPPADGWLDRDGEER